MKHAYCLLRKSHFFFAFYWRRFTLFPLNFTSLLRNSQSIIEMIGTIHPTSNGHCFWFLITSLLISHSGHSEPWLWTWIISIYITIANISMGNFHFIVKLKIACFKEYVKCAVMNPLFGKTCIVEYCLVIQCQKIVNS